MYAIAIDLGTTTLAASLVDTTGGGRLAMTGSLNPQRRFGADLVSRLAAAVASAEAGREMTVLIRDELLRLSRELCASAGVPWDGVRRLAIAGNSAMQHLLLGLPVRGLAFPPYRPLHTSGTHLAASGLGWDGPAVIHLFPMPGGFVGGDTVAFLYGDRGRMVRSEERGVRGNESTTPPLPSPLIPHSSLYLDLGTNAEIALAAGGKIWATSAAAGPAFEGGNLSCGMGALPGAITSLVIEGERVRPVVMGNVTPLGICGSAVLETVVQLLRHGIIEPGGRIVDSAEIPSNLAERVVRRADGNAFVLHRDARGMLMLTQEDVRQIQLALGAIRAGVAVLRQRAGRQGETLERVVLTGSFGAVLRPEWLKTVGIFDEDMVHITSFTPEGVLAGAELALMGEDRFLGVERLAERFRVVPLSGTPLFEKLFLNHLNFPGN